MSREVGEAQRWNNKQAYGLAILCLVVGLPVGYFLRGSAPVTPQVQQQPATQVSQQASPMQAPAMPTPEQLKRMADKQVEPLVAQLKQNDKDAALLAKIGNAYYDAQQLPTAIEYYERALSVDPKQVNVRTDLGTAYCKTGNIDRGLKEFEAVLKYDPAHDKAYLNMGMVKWQVQHDASGAITAWRQLLEHNPRYERRAQLEQLMAQVQKDAVKR